MKPRSFVAVFTTFCALILAAQIQAQKIKIILDQDARGPATTDMQSLLILLQSDKFDVLGITTVSGDQWMKEETQRTLRLLEIAGRTDVPVAEGALFPLLNSKEESERWENLYGKLGYKGCWSDLSKRPKVWEAYKAGYHDPLVVPPLVEGKPHIKPIAESAAEFIVRVVHKYPGEVVIWAGGPMTNIALALQSPGSSASRTSGRNRIHLKTSIQGLTQHGRRYKAVEVPGSQPVIDRRLKALLIDAAQQVPTEVLELQRSHKNTA